MLARSADSLCLDDVFVELSGYVAGSQVALKIEGFNAAGSIKLKTALGLIADAERRRGLKRGGRVVESSSGNLGVALGIVCAVRGYRFTCVTDPNASSSHLAIMRRLGVQVVVVDRRDEQGGYLGQRLKYIEERLREDPELIWTNQYANTANSNAHYELTAAAILREFNRVDYLFVGAGTTGTLMGCVRRFREKSPATEIVAVDAAGSVTFGFAAGPRRIPGLGTSLRPPLYDPVGVDSVILIEEFDAIETCRSLAATYGLLVGGSTGSVLAAVRRYATQIPRGSTVVAISPDLGDRYIDMIYDDKWVQKNYGQPPGDCSRKASVAPEPDLSRTDCPAAS
jgi:2,3-diaminopropionate biosynthesis protein SbnA